MSKMPADLFSRTRVWLGKFVPIHFGRHFLQREWSGHWYAIGVAVWLVYHWSGPAERDLIVAAVLAHWLQPQIADTLSPAVRFHRRSSSWTLLCLISQILTWTLCSVSRSPCNLFLALLLCNVPPPPPPPLPTPTHPNPNSIQLPPLKSIRAISFYSITQAIKSHVSIGTSTLYAQTWL